METVFEKIMNYFGWYKLPRYYIYNIKEDGTEDKFVWGKNRSCIYNYYDMLEFTSMLDNLKGNKIKYRIKRINIS